MDSLSPTPSSKSSEPDRPNVLLLGYGPTAASAFRSLLRHCRVVGLVRERPAGGKSDDLIDAAESAGIPVLSGSGTPALRAAVMATQPQLVVVSSYDRIIGRELLATVPFINVHYSPLPQYRGRANVNWAIINGEATAAISIHWIDSHLDNGNLLFQAEIAIGERDTVADLYERLNALQEHALGLAAVRAAAGDPGRAQSEAAASYGCSRVPDDGEIDWRQSTAAIDRLIRALAPPFPFAFTHLCGHRVEICRAVPCLDAPHYSGRVSGRVVGRSAREGWVDVLTGDGVLRLLEVSVDGRSRIAAATVITSTRQTLGLSKLELLNRITTLEQRIAALEARVASSKEPVATPGGVAVDLG